MNVRIDDTFVCSSEGVAKGAIFAVDGGASVINMALGMLNSSTLARGAFDYATTKNVLAVNASANEFSFHHNFASVYDDVMTIGGVTANDRGNPTTWVQKANFSNFGAHLNVVTPTEVPNAGQGHDGSDPDNARYGSQGSGTSSAVPHAAGIAALVFSRARDLIAVGALDVGGLSLPDVSAQEVRQLIDRTADDVTPLDGTDYPVSVGWDKWTGYGRANAAAAVALVSATTMPPEADVNVPEWYSINTGTVDVAFYANARWASDFDYLVEVGEGVEPESFAWCTRDRASRPRSTWRRKGTRTCARRSPTTSGARAA
jgi:subtilisin family serine protease